MCCEADYDIGAFYCTMKLANGYSLQHVVNLNGSYYIIHTHPSLSLSLSVCLSSCYSDVGTDSLHD